MQVYRVGECSNCGACCYIYSKQLGHFHVCGMYDASTDKHCRLHGKPNRPKECIEYPSCPMDLERVWRWCTYKFVDELGRVVDPYMQKNVKLTPTS